MFQFHSRSIGILIEIYDLDREIILATATGGRSGVCNYIGGQARGLVGRRLGGNSLVSPMKKQKPDTSGGERRRAQASGGDCLEMVSASAQERQDDVS